MFHNSASNGLSLFTRSLLERTLSSKATCISEQVPQGPVRPISQKLLSTPNGKIRSAGTLNNKYCNIHPAIRQMNKN